MHRTSLLAIAILFSAHPTTAAELLQDTAFAEGFGASWIYGAEFTGHDRLREGTVTAFRDISPARIHLIPWGPVSKVGVRDYPWEFEEGPHQKYTNERGEFIDELHKHRLAVNHVIEADTPESLRFAQFNNDGLPEDDPQRDTRLVKRVTTDRRGAIHLYYNTQNEVRNVATGYLPLFARDVWPHLLLVQRFVDRPKLAEFESLDFSLKYQVSLLERLSDWPAHVAGSAGPDMNLQFFFLLREVDNPGHALWIGMLLHPSNPRICFVHTAAEQWGIVMHRRPVMPNGVAPVVGQRNTARCELKSMVREALEAAAAKLPDKRLAREPDDYYLSLINVGWEGIGHWRAECELSAMSLQGTPIVEPIE